MNSVFYRQWPWRLAGLITAACAASLWWVSLAEAQDALASVEPENLVSAPQRYWARAVLFKDTLTSTPADRGVRINDKVYFPLTTRVVGTCYAPEEAAAAMRSLDLHRAYAFSAMVIQHRGRYYVIVSGATPVVDTIQMVKDLQSLAPGMDAATSEAALKPIAEIVWEVESAHLAYAKEKGIPLCELYDPRSVHFSRAMELVRAAIMKREVEQRAVSSEILAQYLLLALARTCAASNIPSASTGEPLKAEEALPLTKKETTPLSASPPEHVPAQETMRVSSAPIDEDAESMPLQEPVADAEPAAGAAEMAEVPVPLAEVPKLSFWQRWKAQREQRRLEAARAAEAEERARQEARQREEEAAALREKEQREKEEALVAERQRKAEEKKRAKEEARRLREEQKAAAARAREEAASMRLLQTEESSAADENRTYEEDRQALERALREKEQEERERELAEASRRALEEAERQRVAEKRAQEEREKQAQKQAEQEQRALEEAARKRAEEESRAAALAEAEIQRRTAQASTASGSVVATETSAPEPQPAQPSWWKRFKERRRLAREEAEKRRKAWEEFLKQEEERIRAEKEARRREREQRAEEARRAKETAREKALAESTKARDSTSAEVSAPSSAVSTNPPPQTEQSGRPAATVSTLPTVPVSPPPAPLPAQAPMVETAPIMPATHTSTSENQVIIDLSTEPPPAVLSTEALERARREEEEHYKRFLENMLREQERRERERKRLEREMERQLQQQQ